MENNLIVVDDEDKITDFKPRSVIERRKLRFRVSALWITNLKGDILLAKRPYSESLDRGRWGPAVIGTVEQGESYKINILREAKEELGLDGIFVRKGPKMKVDEKRKLFAQFFTYETSKRTFKINKKEVERVKWFTIDELNKVVKEKPRLFIREMRDIVALLSDKP